MRAALPTTSKPVSTVQQFNILDRLAKKILQWDFISDWKGEVGNKSEHLFRVLPDAFTSSQQYIETWEPLLIRETQQGIIADIRSEWNSSIKPNIASLEFLSTIEGDQVVHICARIPSCEDNTFETYVVNIITLIL